MDEQSGRRRDSVQKDVLPKRDPAAIPKAWVHGLTWEKGVIGKSEMRQRPWSMRGPLNPTTGVFKEEAVREGVKKGDVEMKGFDLR